MIDIESTQKELMELYPECRVKISDDKREMVAEITDDFAVAVIDKSQAHFHLRTRETYRVLSKKAFTNISLRTRDRSG